MSLLCAETNFRHNEDEIDTDHSWQGKRADFRLRNELG